MSAIDEILDADMHVDGTSRSDYEVDGATIKDATVIRRILIDIARLERRREQVKQLRQRVTLEYQQAELELEQRIDNARQTVQSYIENVNEGEPVSFPDVGSAHLTRRGPRLYVKDAVVFEAWANEMGYLTIDVPAATKAAKERLKETGEVAHGCEVEPGATTLTVKR